LANFPNSYQVRLLALLCVDKKVFSKYGSRLEDTMFSTQVCQWIFNTLKTYYKDYSKSPVRNVFDTELSKEDAFQPLPEEQPFLQEFLALVTSGVVSDAEYIEDTLYSYIASKTMRNVLSEQTENVDGGEFDEVLGALRKSRRELISQSEGGLVDEYGHVFSLKNLEEIYLERTAIKTGFSLIDNEIKGVVAKELTLVLGDTNVGKSIALAQMGAFIVKQYRKVLHVTLEMSAARTLARYLSMMSVGDPEWEWITINDILNFDPEMTHRIAKYVALHLRPKYEGFLHIEELPTGKGSLEMIAGLVDLHRPTVLVVDYLDLLKPPKTRQDYRFELKDVTTQLRGLAVEHNIPIITATQANRMAAGKRIVRKEMVAEDYEKIRIADTAFSIGQSKSDADRNQVAFYLMKARNADRETAQLYTLDKRKVCFKYMNDIVLGRDD